MRDFEKIIMAGLPCLVRGEAGTGKSSILRAFAKKHGRDFIDLRVAMMPPEDLIGIPKPENGYFTYLAPEWAAKNAHNKGAGLLIILEEIHLAPPAMHAALYNLLQEKEVAGVDLSDAWIAATANPDEQAGAGLMAELPEALRDRLEIVEFKNEGQSCEWLNNLADELKIDLKVKKALRIEDNDLPITPRAAERLLRLVEAGVTDHDIISRRAGRVSDQIMAALLTNDIEDDILHKVVTKRAIAQSAVFSGEGWQR